jgi:hypothetical protein
MWQVMCRVIAWLLRGQEMNKPSKTEFQDLVNDYINAGLGEMADVYAELDNWTHYYKSKFWSAIYEWRASND